MIVLRYLLEYTPGEIAELLDLPRGTVNSRLRRGLDRLEEELRVNVQGALLEQVPVDPDGGGAGVGGRRRGVRASASGRTSARRRWPLAVPVVAVAVVAAAAFSPPGRAVVDAVRRTIGVEHAAPALFRLPAPGRLLVSGAGGTWVVAADGSKRRLGDDGQASWSPHGLFVVVASGDTLAAVEPRARRRCAGRSRGRVSLFPRWGGSRADTRIAYLSAGRLRVVAGDGTGDVDARAAAARVAPAWQPERHVLAYATPRGGVAVVDVDSKAVLAVHAARGARELAWSPDGKQLVARDAEARARLGAAARASMLRACRRAGGRVRARRAGSRSCTDGTCSSTGRARRGNALHRARRGSRASRGRRTAAGS